MSFAGPVPMQLLTNAINAQTKPIVTALSVSPAVRLATKKTKPTVSVSLTRPSLALQKLTTAIQGGLRKI